MTVFLADRGNLQARRLHRRIRNRLRSDGRFDAVRLRVTEPREPGPYRVVAELEPTRFLDDPSYPAKSARIEVGFQLASGADHEYYWFNWIEPDRRLLLGWHRDDDHPDLGPTHLQVNSGGTAVDRDSADLLDEHPMAVLEVRLEQLPDAIRRVEWDDATVAGLE